MACHRRLVTFVIVAVALLGLTGSRALQNGTAGESARAETMMKLCQVRPAQHEFAYLHSDRLSVADPTFRAAIAKVVASMGQTLGGPVTTTVSARGHSALLAGPIGRPFSTDTLRASVAAAGGPQVTSVLDDNSGNSSRSSDLQRAERLSLPVTLLVLLIAFGALVAAVVPVLLGATAVIATFGLLGPISHVGSARPRRKNRGAAHRDGRRRRLRPLLRDPVP